jgi:predicted dehydrogenase
MNLPDGAYFGKAQVISLWGENKTQTAEKADKYKIPMAATIEDALKGADVAMCVGRFGNSHFEPAKAALQKGLPTFVDNPFTTDLKEARELQKIAQDLKVPLCSSSPLRFANEVVSLKQELGDGIRSVTVHAPANCIDLKGDIRFESVFFYGIHGVEVLLELLGTDHSNLTNMKIVYAGDDVCVHFSKGDKSGTLKLVKNVEETYSLEVFSKDKNYQRTIGLDGSYYTNMLTHIFGDFFGKKKGVPVENTLKAIEILESVEKGIGRDH